MEMFIGTFEKSEDQTIFPKDDDDFYELEELHKCHYVRVNDVIYKFWGICEVDGYGFEEVIPKQEGPILICYWYNGGAGIHEVVEQAIKKWLDNQEGESS